MHDLGCVAHSSHKVCFRALSIKCVCKVYYVSVAECGGYLTGSAGTFSYPNNPGHDEYDHQVSCTWVIRTDANKVSCSLYLKEGFFKIQFSKIIEPKNMMWNCYIVSIAGIKYCTQYQNQ